MSEHFDEQKCEKSGRSGDLCWVFQPDGSAGASNFSLKETINRCLKCPSFEKAIQRSTGRRESDRLLTLTLHRLLGQLVDYDTELTSITNSLERRVDELAVVKSVSEALLKTQDLKKVMLITLTGVTSGEGFGFNRAMVFLVNTHRNSLDGQLGLGHVDVAEAPRVWNHISEQHLTFNELVDHILGTESSDIIDNDLTREIEQISIPILPDQGVLIESVIEKESFNIEKGSQDIIINPELGKILEGIPFAVVPLISESRVLGVIVADNSVNNNPIKSEDVVTLETLANHTAGKIENALLHQKLEARFAELEHVHSLLKDNQKYMVESERLADLGLLATTVAHEIKTPLATIGGYAARVLRKIDNGKADRRDVEIICDEIRRLERICREILDYSQRNQLNLVKYDLNQIINETLEREKSKLKYQNISFKTNLHSGKLAVLSDKDRLMQVLYNLIQNAAEAMENGGRITVKTGRNGDYVYFQISDNGCGMDDEIQSKLFTPFFTNKRKGTGLGLPVSKKIIDDHGGNINVESEAEKGTCFTVSLPAAKAD